MSALAGVAAGLFLFGSGLTAGWRAAGAHDELDRRLLVTRRNETEQDR
jgi:hypothetical protein